MKLFDVYSLFDITPVKGDGCFIWDDQGNKYLDFYGGHAVISIGHSHPHYVERLTEQINKIGFYSNSVQNPMQQELATKLGELCGLPEYHLFLCNSGAEANENALKLASFHTGRSKVVAFEKGFHGRTSGVVAATDNQALISPFNAHHEISILPLNDLEKVEEELRQREVAAVIIEGIQGIGGIHVPDPAFLHALKKVCTKYGTVLILDEIQSGYGRSGKFFAFQYADVQPDLITVAKGMGNGFPVGAVLIAPEFKAKKGLLGTTFGGNYLACAASLAVLEVMEAENLIEHSRLMGDYLLENLKKSHIFKELRGLGLMLGVECHENISALRMHLLNENRIFTGVSGTNTIRLLPPMTLLQDHADYMLSSLQENVNST